MKFFRYLAAVVVTAAAFGVVAPNASAKSPLCPDCLTEGIVQGSGIMPDPTSLVLGFNFINGGTDPLQASTNFTAFEGSIVQGTPFTVGEFEATGVLTIDNILPGGGTFSAPAQVYSYIDPLKPAYGIEISSFDVDSGLTFYGLVYQTPYVAAGLPSLWTSGVYGHPLVGTAKLY